MLLHISSTTRDHADALILQEATALKLDGDYNNSVKLLKVYKIPNE